MLLIFLDLTVCVNVHAVPGTARRMTKWRKNTKGRLRSVCTPLLAASLMRKQTKQGYRQ